MTQTQNKRLDAVITTVLDDCSPDNPRPLCVYVAHVQPGTNLLHLFQWKHCDADAAQTFLSIYGETYQPSRSFSFRTSQLCSELNILPLSMTTHDVEQYASIVLADEYWRNFRYQQMRSAA